VIDDVSQHGTRIVGRELVAAAGLDVADLAVDQATHLSEERGVA